MHRIHLSATSLLIMAGFAHAQAPAPIERIKITDNDLTCRQMFDEREAMDKEIANAKAAQSSGQTTATAGQAAGVAAEVAQRTGLFGQLGGLTGHLFGSVASKAAANVAEQTGQQDAAAAAEREKQALARKEHLTGLFLAKGCSASDPSEPAKAPGATASLAAAPAAAVAAAPVASTAMPAADILTGARAGKLDVKVNVANPEDLLDSNKTVVVPTAYVRLLSAGRVSAAKQAGAFQSGSGSAVASARYRVSGIDRTYAQVLAKAAYDNFIAQMRQAGYTVLTYDDIKERDVIRGAQRESGGLVADSENNNDFVIAAPSDEQHFKAGFRGNVMAEFQSGGKSRFADATLIIPQYTFSAPQAWTETSRGYKSVSAEANVVHGMNMTQASAYWMGQPRSRMMSGIPGVATREQVINASMRVGSLTQTADTTPTASNAVSAGLSGLLGGGGIQRSSAEYLLTIDRDAYAAGVMNGVANFNAEVARVAAAARQ